MHDEAHANCEAVMKMWVGELRHWIEFLTGVLL